MKLIREVNENIIVEAAKNGSDYFVEGVFLQSNIKNRNGRRYPLPILKNEVSRYNQEFISQNRAFGELGHPDTPTINLERVSHLTLQLEQDGENFVGKAKVIDTPNGKIVKTLIDCGSKLAVSSRGVGTLRANADGINEVQSDFILSTCADIVADPSAPSAFVRGIVESREYFFENGILTERQVDRIEKQVKKLPRKQLEEAILRDFERILARL